MAPEAILGLKTPLLVMSRWPPHSKSACSQVCVSPSVMFDRTVKFVRAWIRFADNMRASRLQAKGRLRHLSQNIGPAVTGVRGVNDSSA